MAHKVLVGGTGYAIKGGRTLIGGTGYAIKGGRTLIGGTGYKISFGPIKTTLTIEAAMSNWDDCIYIYVNDKLVHVIYVQLEAVYACEVFEGDKISVYAEFMGPQNYSGLANVQTDQFGLTGNVTENPYVLFVDVV